MKLIKPTYTSDCESAVLIKDKYGFSPYFVKFDIIYDNDGVPERCEILEFCPTKQPLDDDDDYRWGGYVKWGGYPDFKQSEAVPYSDDGREYKFLCSVDNGWGDSGTCNIFLLLKDGILGLEVEDVYMEASCS